MRTIKILLTFGPASVPIDDVRRITNHSTGSLGTALTHYFLKQNHEVIALRGDGATVPASFPYFRFNTNHDLAQSLSTLQHKFQPDLILHAAALSDYEIDSITPAGECSSLAKRKLSSHHEHLTLRLKPAPKILPHLRTWFPKSKIVSWKYELEGSLEESIQKALQQIHQNKSDYSVINGKAYGNGFGLCNQRGVIHHHLNALELAQILLTLLSPSPSSSLNPNEGPSTLSI